MKEITDTSKYVLPIAWAFFWRWNVGVFACIITEKIASHYLGPLGASNTLYAYAIANFILMYVIFGNFLTTKVFKGYRIGLLSTEPLDKAVKLDGKE